MTITMTMTATIVDHVELSSHWKSILNRKWLIISISCLFSFFCMVYTLIKPTQYRASVLLQIHPNQRGSLGNISSVNPSEPVAVLIALIRSKFILEPVIQSLHLDTKTTRWEVMKQILAKLQIIDLAGTGENSANMPDILQLSLTGNNPDAVIQLINQIALTAQQKDRERKSLEAKKTLEFLYQQLPIIRNALNNAETKLNQYRLSSGSIDPKLQSIVPRIT